MNQKLNLAPVKYLIALAICSFTFNSGHSQAPKYSNEFLSIGVGARAMGMSNAVVAHISDGTAGYWNPAGLVNVAGNLQVNLMHAEYFAGIAKYDYGSIAAPVDATSTLGLSFVRFAVDDIPDTSELIDADGNINYDKIRSFTAADYAFLFSYAKRSKIKGLQYGGNAKVVHRVVGPYASAWGFGLDLGVQYETGNWKFGAMAKDITTTYNAWNFTYTDALKEAFLKTNNALPENSLEITLPKIIPGVAYKKTFKEKYSILGEVDLDASFDGKRNVVLGTKLISFDPHVGMELGYDNFFFLRAGVGNIQKVTENGTKSYIVQPNLGVGLKLKNLSIDYALTNLGRESNVLYSNLFSLRLDIFKKTAGVTPQ